MSDPQDDARQKAIAKACDIVAVLVDRHLYKSRVWFTGFFINDSPCLNGCALFRGKVEQTECHYYSCIWRYYVACPACGYQNNLAKFGKDPDGGQIQYPCTC